MKQVLKYKDLLLIEEFLRENDMDSPNLTITMGIETPTRLKNIDREYFYKVNGKDSGLVYDEDEEVDSVTINIGNVNFEYVLIERGTDD